MPTWNAALAEQAVQSLARIRAVEAPPGEDGLKGVWHQGAKGADLLSYVDLKGHVIRQEMTLLEDHFVWTAKDGLGTGYVVEDAGSMAAKASATVKLDETQRALRVRRSHAALLTYQGDDTYIRHLANVLAMAEVGLSEHEEKTVTRSLNRDQLVRVSRAGQWWTFALVALIFGGVGFAVAFLLTRPP